MYKVIRSCPIGGQHLTANLRTSIMDFRGFHSSIILITRGGIIMSIGDFPESLSQAILVGIMLVGRLGIPQKEMLQNMWCMRKLYFGDPKSEKQWSGQAKPMKSHERLVVGFITAVTVICWALILLMGII